jgi:hypothetical protein
MQPSFRPVSLLDHASPPSSPPPTVGLIDALPDHRSSTTALEHRRAGPFLRPTTTGRLRWESRRPTLSDATAVAPPWSPRRARYTQANIAGPRAEMPAQQCAMIFWFSIFI